MNKLMIVGAGIYQVPVIECARQMGIYTVAVSPEGDYPGLKIADKTYNYDVRDKKNILKAAQAEKIDGITTDQTDMAVRSVAYVAEKMHLPGISTSCAEIFTDKFLMQERCAELGLPSIKCKKVRTPEEAADFFEELNAAAIIKPTDNQGSRGVRKINSKEDIERAFSDALKYSGKDVIMEQFIDGSEVEVNDIVIDGEPHTLMYGDITPFEIPNVFASRTRIYPSNKDASCIKNLLDTDKKIIKGFGAAQGFTHSEYMIDKSGTVYLLEVAIRGGGAYVSSHIMPLQTGIHPEHIIVDMALGRLKELPKFKKNLCHSGTLCCYLPYGKIMSVDGINEVQNFPFVYKEHLDDIKVGEMTKPIADKTARYVTVVHANSREELLECFDKIRTVLNVKVKTSDGVKGPIWI